MTMKKKLLLPALLLMAWMMPMSALDRPVSLPYELMGKKDFVSPARTSKIIDGNKYWALELPDIAQSGKVYYLPDARKLLLEDAAIETEESQAIINCFSTATIDIVLTGSNSISSKGTLISGKGAIVLSALEGESASLTLSTQMTAVQCATHITLRNLQVEFASARYALMCTGGRYNDSKVTLENCNANLKATKAVVTGFKHVQTIKCGMPYDEYEDQDICYNMREMKLTHNDHDCLELPLTNEGTFIPINTTGSTFVWQSKNAKPETAGEEESGRVEENALMDEVPTNENEDSGMDETTYGQEEETTLPASEEEITVASEQDDDEKIFIVVEQPPVYGDSHDEFNNYVSEHLAYPAIAQEQGIQGNVIVSFVVETDGSISDPTIVRGVDFSLDKEALRLITDMPNKWHPAKQNGKEVRSKFTVPIRFRLVGK